MAMSGRSAVGTQLERPTAGRAKPVHRNGPLLEREVPGRPLPKTGSSTKALSRIAVAPGRRAARHRLQFNFNWQKLSVSAGLTLRNFYFRLYRGAIGELEVIDSLKALVRHIDRPLLIVWDRLPAHRSRLVREFIELSEGHIATEFLPSYAPELNPVEYIWAYWKQHELPNVCPKDYWELDERARKSLRRMRRKPRLITAFWKQSSLCLD